MSRPAPSSRLRLFRVANRRAAKWVPVAGVVLLVGLSAPFLIGPSCPKYIVMATGSADGAYFTFANRYKELLAEDGITLEVRTTAGSVENRSLLTSAESEVSLAIMQGGIAEPGDAEQLESLASLYLEPVWVFYRADHQKTKVVTNAESRPIERLTELAGKRIAVGAEGSGTRAIALQLLAENKLGPGFDATATLPLNSQDAANALVDGRVDAAFFVISPKSPLVQRLLATDGVELMSFRQAEAYCRRHPFLSSVTLPEGTIDLEQNLPPRDTVLLAPTANLVARKPLHEALVPLLLKAVSHVHEDGGILEERGEFPTGQFVDVPLKAEARRYFKSGPPMFFRILPFSVAAWLDRMKLMLLPLCTLLYPVLKAAPPIYRWRIRSKIYRWYRVLRDIDQKMRTEAGRADFSDDIATLSRLEIELAEVSVPLSYMEEFYNLRVHVAFVRERLEELEAKPAASRRAA